jgi:hypothetical protein
VDDFEALKVAVPETSASVTEASIRGFYKLALYVPSMLILQVYNMEPRNLRILYINRTDSRRIKM